MKFRLSWIVGSVDLEVEANSPEFKIFFVENIYHGLEQMLQEHKVETSVVLSSVGQLMQFELEYFKEKGGWNYDANRWMEEKSADSTGKEGCIFCPRLAIADNFSRQAPV